MGVHRDAQLDVECVSQNNIGGLASDAAKLDQFFHRARHLTAMFFNNGTRGGLDVLGFVAIEAGSLNRLFEFGQFRFGEIVADDLQSDRTVGVLLALTEAARNRHARQTGQAG